jgi:hypothetical protein
MDPRATCEQARFLMIALELRLLDPELDEDMRADTLQAMAYLAPFAEEPV